VSVYVDPIAAWGGSKAFRWTRSCHLLADTVEELHAMALRIGMKREWFQNERLKHYDLTESKRRAAIAAGTIEVSFGQMAEFMKSGKIVGTAADNRQPSLFGEPAVENQSRRIDGTENGAICEGGTRGVLQ
jgi:hypothetical protein